MLIPKEKRAHMLEALKLWSMAEYEATDSSLSPWPEDPDSGAMRFSTAIKLMLEDHYRGDWMIEALWEYLGMAESTVAKTHEAWAKDSRFKQVPAADILGPVMSGYIPGLQAAVKSDPKAEIRHLGRSMNTYKCGYKGCVVCGG